MYIVTNPEEFKFPVTNETRAIQSNVYLVLTLIVKLNNTDTLLTLVSNSLNITPFQYYE